MGITFILTVIVIYFDERHFIGQFLSQPAFGVNKIITNLKER